MKGCPYFYNDRLEEKIHSLHPNTFYLCLVLPDYPHKLFADKRCNFNLLMETLAMDAPTP